MDVSDNAGLMAALKSATGGDVIRLAPGDYGTLALRGDSDTWAMWSPAVTITAADPANPPVFTELDLSKGVTGLHIEGMLFDYTFAPGHSSWADPFEVKGCEDIAILNSVFDGDIATTTGPGIEESGVGYATAEGLNVGDSKNVLIEGNEFRTWKVAGAFGGNEGLTVKGNEIHSIRGDGFDFVKNVGVVIEQNHFHDWRRAPESGDHCDMIQFWTTAADHYTADVVIRDNRFMRADGDLTQSIFMRNGMVDTGKATFEALAYRNILIEDNLIWNAHTHGITVGETDGLTVRNNTLLQCVNPGDDLAKLPAPRINMVAASRNVTIEGNIAHAIAAGQPDWTMGENLVVQRSDPTAPSYYGGLFVNAITGRTLADLAAKPDSIIYARELGCSLTRPAIVEPEPEPAPLPAPLPDPTPDPEPPVPGDGKALGVLKKLARSMAQALNDAADELD